MFVRVNVSQANAALLEEVDLRSGFRFDLGCADASCKEARQKRVE